MVPKRDHRPASFKEQLERSGIEPDSPRPKKPALPQTESFADLAKGLGARPLAESPAKIDAPQDARPAVIMDRAQDGPTPAFIVEDLEGWLEGRREGMHERESRGLRRVHVQAELDLHGMAAGEAERALHRFIVRSSEARARFVRVIVGRGKHSPRGRGVLRGAIASWLTDPPSAHRIRAFISAQMRDGGDGAVIVALA